MRFTLARTRHLYFLIVIATLHTNTAIAQIHLNEVYCDSPGTDTLEYIELHGPPAHSLSGLTVVTIEGDSESDIGAVRRAWSLSDPIPDDGFYVLGTTTTPNVDMNVGTSNVLQNGAATILLVSDYTAPPGGDVDADDDGAVDAGISIGTIVDSVARFDKSTAPNVAYFSAPIVGPAAYISSGLNIARRTDGVDTDIPADWCYTSRSDAPSDPPITPPPVGADGLEIATPGVANNHSCPPPPPAAIDVEISLTNADDPVTITLNATDNEAPGPDPLTYEVVFGLHPLAPTTSPDVPNEIGALTDPNNSADLTNGGFLSDHGHQIVFTPAFGVAGRFNFVFSVNDGESDSNVADVELFVQDAGTVIITEIMYDPANAYDSDWEWIELRNLTPSTILLGTLFDSRCDDAIAGNLTFTSIPGNATRIIARSTNMSRDVLTFLAEWSLDIANVQLLWPGAEPYFRNDGDTISLFDINARLLDQVKYENGENGWPTANGRSSIFLAGDRINTDATRTNDLPESWHVSIPGVDGAYATPEDNACQPVDSDVGSPAFLPSGPPASPATPVVDDQTLDMHADDEPLEIILSADNPGGDPLAFVIMAGPEPCGLTPGEGGTLTDTETGLPIVLDTPLAEDRVSFSPPPLASGMYAFAYQAVGAVESNIGVVTIDVQDRDRVVITEIMSNPARFSTIHNQPVEWEWIEVTNTCVSEIALGTLWDLAQSTTGNLAGVQILPGQTKVIARIDTQPSPEDFLAEWALANLTAEDVIAVPSDQWPTLAQTGDTLWLFDANGHLLDKVIYEIWRDWPDDEEGRSVFLAFNHLSSVDNDDGENWRASADGFENAVTSASGDVGSPGALAFGHNMPPQAIDMCAGVLMDTPREIVLETSDDGLPLGQLLSYTIVSVPQYGTLVDPVTDQPILASDLPYTLTDNGNVVRYTPMPGYTSAPPPMLGEDSFRFMVDDGELSSGLPYGRATVVVQAGGLVITEIMYDPANVDDADWEWIEVANTSDEDITLATLTDDDDEPDGRTVVDTVIPAGATRVVTSGNNSSRSADDFLAEWSPLSADNVIFVGGDLADDDWEGLGYDDRIQILDDQARLLDEVWYANNWPWPLNDTQASIYLFADKFDPLNNDEPGHWELSVAGTANAIRTAGGDVGSPGLKPSDPTEAPQVVRAASRRQHGDSGMFDIEIPLDGPPPIEPRENGDRPQFIIEFDAPIEAVDGLPACSDEITVVNGTCLDVTIDGTQLIVDMAFDNNSCVEVVLAGLRGGGGSPVVDLPALRVLTNAGNADLTSGVNVIDLQTIKNALFQEVDETNFLNDCNAGGGPLNVIDLQCAKNNLFNTAQCP